MIATLKFNRENEDDARRLSRALKADDMWFAMSEFANDVLRQNRKYREFKTEEARKLVEEIDKQFHECLIEWEINLWSDG